MSLSATPGVTQASPVNSERVIWLALIAASGTCLSTLFACVTPFAALATLAALKLRRRDAAYALATAWIANQAIGYGLLGYPWTWDSIAWGAAIGVSTALAALTARGLASPRPSSLMISLPFVGGFAAFELALYLAGFTLPGAEGAFAASVVWHVFLINAIALSGLMAAYYVATAVWSSLRQMLPAYRVA